MDVSLGSMLFWLLVTFAGIYVLNIVDGTNKWHKNFQRDFHKPQDGPHHG